jgi:GAF domain-containing protein
MATGNRSVSARSARIRKRKTVARASPRTGTDELARLRSELAECRRDLAEAHEQQAATAEILEVISSSPTDLRPVFDAILESATRLCDAHTANLLLRDGDTVLPVAQRGGSAEYAQWVMNRGPYRPVAGGDMARMLAEGRPVQVADLMDSSEYRARTPGAVALVELGGARSRLNVPMLKEGRVVGGLNIYRPEVRPFTQKQIDLLATFAAQAVIAIENVRLFNETKEALEQQTATAEILKVISSSPTDTQPVFEAIVKSGVRLFDGMDVSLRLVKGNHTEIVASTNPVVDEADRFRLPLSDSEIASARAIQTRDVVQVADLLARRGVSERASKRAQQRGYRAIASTPLLREKSAIGAIAVTRPTPGIFSDKQIALLRAFADQAVIAIENARLFNETKEALERQTATAEVLGVISSSPTDLQPVFDVILEKAIRLCDAHMGHLGLYDGEKYQYVAQRGVNAEYAKFLGERGAFQPRGVLTRMIVERQPVHVADTGDSPEYRERLSGTVAIVELGGARSFIVVPMLKEGRVVGGIHVYRPEVRPFTDRQIELVSTFSSQAVIAIENVRLFKELEARNAEVTESLKQQTATSEVLKVISRSTFDLQPVLDTLMENGARLCGADSGVLYRLEGDVLRMGADYRISPEFKDYWQQAEIHPGPGSASGRATLERRTVHITDVLAEPGYELFEAQRIGEFRTLLCVPMIREGVVFGVINMWRSRVERFTDKQIGLVETFADQAVIAIENVRLFRELQARNTEVTEALERQTATAEILKVISSSPTDTQPVFEAIVKSGHRLFGNANVTLRLVRGNQTEIVATTEPLEDRLPTPLGDESRASARAVMRREVVHVPDILADERMSEISKARAISRGNRALVYAPMIHDSHAIGAIGVLRRTPGPFTDKEIALLQTFAAQAVIAIENVRLFNETKEALEQQTATSEILKVISSSPTDVQPVFEAIVRSAVRVGNAAFGFLVNYDGQLMHFAASHDVDAQAEAVYRSAFPRPATRDSIMGRAILDRAVVNLAEIETSDLSESPKARARQAGFRSVLAVPMMRGDVPIGVVAISKREAGAFSDAYVVLLQTFADQAVIAIENVRLFKELQARNAEITEALEQQTATAEILKVISSSPTDLQPVFDAILDKATQLCDSNFGNFGLYDGENYQFAAVRTGDAEVEKWAHDRGPFRPNPGSPMSQLLRDGQPFQIADVKESAEYRNRRPMLTLLVERVGVRTHLGVPMLKEGRAVGSIHIYRPEVRPFTQKQIDLLSTFANQAVIAIENVRLFKELQARNAELSESLEQQTTTSEILRIISSSPTETQPVFDAIVKSGVHLFGGMNITLWLVKDDHAGPVASTIPFDPAHFLIPLNDPWSPQTLAIQRRDVVQIADTLAGEWASTPFRGRSEQRGFRSVLSVPMLRENVAIGAINVLRTTPGAFTDKEVELLKTFASQAVIAIENARLFNEIQDKSRELEIANKHKSEFLATMSHELRTPLNSVIGFSDLMLERLYGELNEKQENYIRNIQLSGKHLLSLINDILDLSKIEAGRMELDVAQVHIPSALQNAMMLVRERAERQSVTLSCHVDPQVGSIPADERKFKQVMLNLLSNAVKFTPPGGRVDVDARLANGHLEVSVRDTGVGIAPENRQAVFEEFRQVGRTGSSTQEGTGLGLALARRFAELHGGAISLESEPGKGSTFTVSIPVRP